MHTPGMPTNGMTNHMQKHQTKQEKKVIKPNAKMLEDLRVDITPQPEDFKGKGIKTQTNANEANKPEGIFKSNRPS